MGPGPLYTAFCMAHCHLFHRAREREGTMSKVNPKQDRPVYVTQNIPKVFRLSFALRWTPMIFLWGELSGSDDDGVWCNMTGFMNVAVKLRGSCKQLCSMISSELTINVIQRRTDPLNLCKPRNTTLWRTGVHLKLYFKKCNQQVELSILIMNKMTPMI